MDARQYVEAGRKFWWLLLVGLLLGAGLGVYRVDSAEREYRGTVTFFVRTASEGTASAANVGDQFAQRRVNSYIALLSTDRLADMLIEDTGLELTPGEMRARISGSSDIDTVLLTANVTDTDRERVLLIAEALSREFVRLIDEVENPDNRPAPLQLELVSGPAARVIPTPARLTVMMHAFFGLALAAVAALILNLLNKAIRSRDDLSAISPAPVLGMIPFDRRVKTAPLIIGRDAISARAESYRELRTNIQFLDLEQRLQVVAVTSSVEEEGKSSTAANLAIAMAQSDVSILLIEADLRRPKVADLFGIERTAGLTDVLLGRLDFESAWQRWGSTRLAILPSGTLPPNPSELLGSQAMERMLNRARQRFDFILLDLPPLLPVTDAAVAATKSDGVIFAVRFDHTKRVQVDRSLSALERVDARFLGFVGTMVPSRGFQSYGSYRGEYGSDLNLAPPKAGDVLPS